VCLCACLCVCLCVCVGWLAETKYFFDGGVSDGHSVNAVGVCEWMWSHQYIHRVSFSLSLRLCPTWAIPDTSLTFSLFV